ncbi:Receptor expression-enhancing protein 5 [Tyrophagus putrescentiae]|nr:Receptor expression-enhancing protein 5 [Tyrophagus putrescentiae]
MSAKYQQVVDGVDKYLKTPGPVNDYATKIESLTGVKRIYIAQGVFGLFSLYMIFGYFAQLVCNLVGFVYPAYKSIAALETHQTDDDVKWLTYWVVFALFSLFDFFSGWLLSCLPRLVLSAPSTMAPCTSTGTTSKRFFLSNHSKIDAALGKAKDTVKNVIDSAKHD